MTLAEYAASIRLRIDSETGLVMPISIPDGLRLMGSGRSAAVFHSDSAPDRVLKLFHPAFLKMASQEIEVYRILGKTNYYPQMYAHGDNYLVIDYIDGRTFYQCLVEGVLIPEEAIVQVDEAVELARQKGLNPSDLHLKNMMLTSDGVKLIDVARFMQQKTCGQWADLRKAYYTKYRRPMFPKKLPEKVLDWIVIKYRRNEIHI